MCVFLCGCVFVCVRDLVWLNSLLLGRHRSEQARTLQLEVCVSTLLLVVCVSTVDSVSFEGLAETLLSDGVVGAQPHAPTHTYTQAQELHVCVFVLFFFFFFDHAPTLYMHYLFTHSLIHTHTQIKTQTQVCVSIIDFSVSFEGLTEALLGDVVGHQRPALEDQRTRTLLALAADKKVCVCLIFCWCVFV